MQVHSTLGSRYRCVGAVVPTGRVNSALLTRPRRLGGYIQAHNEFHEGAGMVEASQGNSSSSYRKEKDPSRYVADTSDEEANLPENPIDLDEEIIIPHRPSISDLYKDVRHEWTEPDLSKGKVVADTSDEESNLPQDPLDLDEEMMIPQKQMVKEIYEHLPKKKEEHPQPGSHEKPEVVPPQHGEREENMIGAEKDVTKMESKQAHADTRPRPASELPGLVNQDTTLINPDAGGPIEFHESGVAENEERIQGIFEAMDKIADDEKHHHQHDEQKQPSTADALSPPPSSLHSHSKPEELRSAKKEDPSTEASYTGLEGGIEDQVKVDPPGELETYEINYSGEEDQIIIDSNGGAGGSSGGSGGGLPNTNTPLGRIEFSFKAEDKEENQKNSQSANSDRLRDVPAKAAAAGHEMDPLTKLTAARQAYREHRTMTEEALHQTKPSVTLARIIEVSAGRAAVVGVFSSVASEILLGQSVLSQLLGRWEGYRQVEAVVAQSRTLALAVIALSLGITAAESLLSSLAPPVGKYFGFTPKQQIWVGRIAMAAFLGIVVYETMHSNRPLFPFWYLLR